MHTTRIHADKDYMIDSHGNGFAYTVTRSDGQSISLQGADALQLEQDTGDFECLDVLEDYFALSGHWPDSWAYP